MREEVLREFRAPDGKHIGTVSRNSAGCHVLNTNGLLFVDVDTPEQASGGGVLGRLFGRKQIDPQTKTEEDAAATAQHWVQSNPEWGWRLYRTKAGVRLMAVHRPIDPSDSLVQRVFDAFKADSLYRKLCENQGCYCARLTPKPWRCGVARVPDRWPWKSVTTEQAFRNWDVEYTAQSRRFATCRFLNAFGRGAIAPEFNELVAFHDEHAQSSANLPLA